ncbi:MAG TPA: hypothetical protein VHR72_12705 [Gemmataceae bacterium]|nr:hypothetical protein [Gemmataceae bacterium]
MCLLGVGGCGQRRVEPTAVTSYENLGAINGAYSKATRTLNRPPKSLDELLPFLKEVGDPEAILRSPRDGEPYVIVWDVDLREKGPVPIFAYERLGKDGSRFISNGRIVSKMTNEDFGKANFPAGHRPSP